MRIRSSRRHSAAALALAGLVVTAAGCNGDSNADPEPLPPTSSSSSPSGATTSPAPTPSGWESEFTEEQLAEYQGALGRWEDYERESEPIWADPKPTAETLKFFASYFYNEDVMQGRLKLYANPDVEVKIEGLPTVLWSKALSIQGKSVTIRQCVDYTTVHAAQHGNPVTDQSKVPLLREIDLSVPGGQSQYLVKEIHDGSWGRKEQKCSA